MIEPLLEEYAARRSALEAVGQDTAARLEAALAGRGIPVQFVSWRLKSPASLRHKLSRPDRTYRSLWDVMDLVGVRLATYFEDGLEPVARLVEQTFPIDLRHSRDTLAPGDASRFGYRSLHYVCGAPGAPELPPEFRFELQLRTSLQHAWAEVEHDLGYKAADAVPEAIRRRFNRVASLLEIADQEFVAIRRSLADYQAAVRAGLADRGPAVPIDQLSLGPLVAQARVEELDGAIARHLGRPLVGEPFFPAYLARMLPLAGLGTTGELAAAVARHGPRVPGILDPYFAFARRALGLEVEGLDRVERGYSLLFVAHLAVVDGPELELAKVGRLTRLYRELDFPDDEAAAHRIASGLLEALRAAPPDPA